MMMQASNGEEVALEKLGTKLSRVRCQQPALVERMRHSLAQHGQLTVVVAVKRPTGLELLDGFKRRQAAESLSWKTLQVSVRELPEHLQWATMLLLNRGPHSMSVLEEALVLQEMARAGVSQVAIAELVQRHKSWVSRRIGLVERLHPELVEQIKLGLMSAGVARRLLALPPGNQLELAAVATQSQLGAAQTERLVQAWQQAPDGEIRSFLLREPMTALNNLTPTSRSTTPNDPRLTTHGQRAQRLLQMVEGMGRELLQLVPVVLREDRIRLASQLGTTHEIARRLVDVLGCYVSNGSDAASDGNGVTAQSAG